METVQEEVLDPIVIKVDKEATEGLVKINVTEQIIKEMNDQFMKLKITDIMDADQINEVKEAHIKVKEVIAKTGKYCKMAREEANRYAKAWVAKEKEIKGLLAPVEEHLKAERKRVDDELERIRIREERMMQLPDRKVRLEKLGLEMSDDEILEYDDLSWGNFINQKMDEKLSAQEAEMAAKEAELKRKEQELAEKEAELNKPKEPKKSDVVAGPRKSARYDVYLTDDQISVLKPLIESDRGFVANFSVDENRVMMHFFDPKV